MEVKSAPIHMELLQNLKLRQKIISQSGTLLLVERLRSRMELMLIAMEKLMPIAMVKLMPIATEKLPKMMEIKKVTVTAMRMKTCMESSFIS